MDHIAPHLRMVVVTLDARGSGPYLCTIRTIGITGWAITIGESDDNLSTAFGLATRRSALRVAEWIEKFQRRERGGRQAA